jgi:hypothetical protein
MKTAKALLLPRLLRWATYLAMAVVFATALWGLAGSFEFAWKTSFFRIEGEAEDMEMIQALPPWLRVIAICMPAAALLYALWRLASLLALIGAGQVFSAPAANHLRSFGVWLLTATLMENLAVPLLNLTHTLLADLRGAVKFDITSNDIWNMFLSLLFMLVARVLADAYELAEENRQFI